MAMDHNLKERLVAHIRSGGYRVCQYHLAKEGFGRIREWTPWGILAELAGVEHEWRECELLVPSAHRSHKAMYITEGSFDDAEDLLYLYGVEVVPIERTDNPEGDRDVARVALNVAIDQLRYRTFPDETLQRLGITRQEFETLREMADGSYDGSNRIYPATMNQMADWVHRFIATDEPEDPGAEIGPSAEWQDGQSQDVGGSLNASRSRRTLPSSDISDKEVKHYSALPGEPAGAESQS